LKSARVRAIDEDKLPPARVVQAWPDLASHIRTAVVTLVATAR
jgi:hypothetical protein